MTQRQFSLPRPSSARSFRIYLGGVALALLSALLLAWLMLQPPPGDLIALIEFLGVSTLVSLLVGLLARGLRLWQQTSLRLSLVVSSLLAGGLTFFNVWLTAQFMFINRHDLILAEILLVFSSLLMVAFGYLASTGVVENATRLAQAAERVAAGDFAVRVEPVGRDELARTAQTFNAMAGELETTAQKQRELEILRRHLIAWISHDLRTPLTAIRVRAEALADEMVEDPVMVKRYHQQICSEVVRLTGLIDDLFELSQLDAGGLTFDLAPDSLSDLISDSLESFRLQAEAQGVTLSGHTEAGLDPVRMDALKISRLLFNLVENAIQHTRAGGQVMIRAAREAGNVILQVEDTGEGIPPEDLPRIFDRFFRGERSRTRSRDGAGLGLAVAESIAEGHNGTIEAQSRIGQGTTFIARWPG